MVDTVGTFTISLDFELFWGVRDKRSIKDYQKNLDGAREIIPQVLELFKQYDIHATWATVGFLFFKDFSDLAENIPRILPQYDVEKLCPYAYINELLKEEEIEEIGKYHFAKELIALIQDYPYQEIASHTFSHYYTLEPKIDIEAFREDIRYAVNTVKERGVELSSLVFPRNQIDDNSVNVLVGEGIKYYRGNPNHWAYKDGELNKNTLQRIYRFIDIYIDLSGSHSSKPIKHNNGLVEVKSSMFLRPYLQKLKRFEKLKINRIKRAMEDAAQKGENFHLWWHPHNFGVNQVENLNNLEKLLQHFLQLKKDYGMISLNMNELGQDAK